MPTQQDSSQPQVRQQQQLMNSANGQAQSDDQFGSANILSEMQNVIKEGEQVQNELTHYEKELNSFEKQFQMISTENQKEMQQQVDQSVAVLNQQIDQKKLQIKNLQDKYNQLQMALLKGNDRQQNQNQAQTFGANGSNTIMTGNNSNNLQ